MKKIISLILAAAVCFGLLGITATPAAAAEGDEVRAARKIISVVYDDSGSMFGDHWVYTNYAMQALTALLNEQDELYMTYMSRPGSSNPVDLKDISGAVKKIRSWGHSAGTPGESLDTAKQKLDSISENDESTQFWLVILTDGAISDLGMNLQDKLNSFKGTRMSNNSTLNVVYLAMGSGAVSAVSDKAGGLYAYEAADSAAIATTMSDIANLVSGRITADNIKQVNDKTISFNSPLPLYSISVLSQESSAKVVSAASPEETLNINRNIPLDAFEPFDSTELTLFGNAAVINREDGSGTGQVIQAGTYTITFSEPVSVSNLVVQYEPAIGMKLKASRSGVEIAVPDDLVIGDRVDLEVIPVVPGTDEPIPAGSLPHGLSWHLAYFVDGEDEGQENGTKLSGITIKEGKNVISGSMQIPGFAPSGFEIPFEMIPIVYHFGIEVDQPDPLEYMRKTAGSGSVDGSELVFWITNDGIRLSKEEQKSIGVSLDVTDIVCDNSAVQGFFHRFGTALAECDLKRNDDGSYTLSPRPVVPFTAFLMMAGEYTVTVALDRDPAITATGTFTMTASMEDWLDLGIVIGIFVGLGYLIFILFIKYKFKGQTVCYKAYQLNGEGGGTELVNQSNTMYLNPLTLDLLLPKRACEVKFHGMTLRAGPDGTVIIPGRAIAKRVSHYKTSSTDPVTSLYTIVASMRATKRVVGKKTEMSASDEILGKRPIYFRNRSNDVRIWRLNLK